MGTPFKGGPDAAGTRGCQRGCAIVRSGPGCQGLTLVEMLVVVAVIGVLFAVLLPSVGRGAKAARAMRCQTSLRSITFDFSVFADASLHPSRGDDEWRGGGRFSLDTFIESQYGVDEFWEYGAVPVATRRIVKGSDDPMRCLEVEGTLLMNRNRACTNGAVSPPQSVSFGFNLRLSRPDTPGDPGSSPALLSDAILRAGRVPLVWDVDGVEAVDRDPSNNPSLTAPPQGVGGPFSTDAFWWPALRHNGSMNVGFVDGSVAATANPLEETGWRWDYRVK